METCGKKNECKAGNPEYRMVRSSPRTFTYSQGVYAQVPLAHGHGQGLVDLLVDVYEPSFNPLRGHLRPLAIVMPGSGASKNWDYYPEMFMNMASYGFVTMGVNYRNYYDWLTLSGQDYFAKDPLEDLKAVVKYARTFAATFQADPEKIVLIGTGAGGITIANFLSNAWGCKWEMEPGTVKAAAIISGRLQPVGWDENRPVRSDGQTPPIYWTYYMGDSAVWPSQTQGAIKLFRRISGAMMDVNGWPCIEGECHVDKWPCSQNEKSDEMVKWLLFQLGC